MNEVFIAILVATLGATLGGILTRALYILKGQNADKGLHLGTSIGLAFVPVNAVVLLLAPALEGTSDAGDTLASILSLLGIASLPIFLLPFTWVAVYLTLSKKPRDERIAIIPFYRDLIVLQNFLQVFFAIGFIGGLAWLWQSLTTNLSESQVTLDFGVYERRFAATISEGPPFRNEWSWVDTLSVTNMPVPELWFLVWLGIASLAYTLLRRNGQTNALPIAVGLALITPIHTVLVAQLDAELVSQVSWLLLVLLVAATLYLNFQKRSRYMAIGAAALVLVTLPIHNTILQSILEALEPYLAASSTTRVIISGFVNTIRVVLVSVVAATIIGVLVGIGLLSNNYLVRQVSVVYTEIFRNTPLLVQLIFIYQALLIVLPAETAGGIEPTALTSPGQIGPFTLHEHLYVISSQGILFTDLVPTDSFIWLALGLFVGLMVAMAVRWWRKGIQDRTGEPAYTWRYALPTFLFFAGIGWLAAGGWPIGQGPFTVDYPAFVREGFRGQFEGGWRLSLQFVAVFAGLSFYTSAFIADIVRAGIQSVPKGQLEAARSLGLGGSQVLSLVILPQALRLIIPPLGNQYVNLGKNSSLGLAVGFADAYNTVNIANNESGQAVPFFVGLMVIYLSMSITFSLFTNLLNTTTELRTR